MKKENTYAELLCLLIIVFVGTAICVSGLYYGICSLTGTTKSGSDIANIFVASATLLGPLVLFFTFNAWKEQHNKNIDKEIAFKLWEVLDELQFQGITIVSKATDTFKKINIDKYNIDLNYIPPEFNHIKGKLNELSHISTTVILRASDLGQILPEEDYKTFQVQISHLSKDIETLHKAIDELIRLDKPLTLNENLINKFIFVFEGSLNGIIDRSKAFKWELKKFYRA